MSSDTPMTPARRAAIAQAATFLEALRTGLTVLSPVVQRAIEKAVDPKAQKFIESLFDAPHTPAPPKVKTPRAAKASAAKKPTIALPRDTTGDLFSLSPTPVQAHLKPPAAPQAAKRKKLQPSSFGPGLFSPEDFEFEQKHPRGEEAGTINPKTGKLIKPGEFAPKDDTTDDSDDSDNDGTEAGQPDAGDLFAQPAGESSAAVSGASGAGDAGSVPAAQGGRLRADAGKPDRAGRGAARGDQPGEAGGSADAGERGRAASDSEHADRHGELETDADAIEPDPDDAGPIDEPSLPSLLTINTAPLKRGNDYRISDADELGSGGPRTKFRDNIAAIKVLKSLDLSGLPATPEEQAILVRYTGWGWAGSLFDYENERAYSGAKNYSGREWGNEWVNQYRELHDLLSDEEFAAAQSSTKNAHYTSATVVSAIWDAVQAMGFSGGRVLEPGCGSGNFIGLMPAEAWAKSAVTGVEIDPITARIAQQLYQSADIQEAPFQRSVLANDFFDLAIGNVPFQENASVYDPDYEKRRGMRFLTKSLHDYFFAKSLDKLKPGGVTALLTSRYTLDKQDERFRQYLADHADFLGAVRLPDNAFSENAGTQVVTDCIFLRKRAPGQEPNHNGDWSTVVRHDTPSGAVQINQWYVDHPEAILGTLELEKNGMYGGYQQNVKGDDRNIGDAIRQAAAKVLPAGVFAPPAAPVTSESPEAVASAVGPTTHLPGTYVEQDGKIFQQTSSGLVEITKSAYLGRIRSMLPVKAAARHLLQIMADPSTSDQAITAGQAALKGVYDAFVKQHGFMHARLNIIGLHEDPDFALMLALEKWDNESKTATPADIFTRRTVAPTRAAITSASSSHDAMLASLGELGSLDFDHMGKLLGREPSMVAAELEQSGHIFHNPTGSFETHDEYLSGNVREKLAQAEAAARIEPRYQRNVDALKAVQPRDLLPHEIMINLGAGWIDPKIVQQFVHHLLDIKDYNADREGVTANYVGSVSKWFLSKPKDSSHIFSTKATKIWGTSDVSCHELVNLALNLQRPMVYSGKGEDRHFDEVSTKQAEIKQEAIKDEFKRWIWSDPERAKKLAEQYNTEFNCIRPRVFDGSHLTLPGLSEVAKARLGSHVKDAVWRVIQQPNTLLAECVGAGKSWMKIISSMELRRLGLAQKPMITVPGHVVPQIAAEFQTLYPNANILMVTKRDFEKDKRRELMARIATGNWDAVVIAHSQYTRIPVTEETEVAHRKQQIDEINDVINAMRADKEDARTVKQIEKIRDTMKEGAARRLAKRKAAADDFLPFEHLGVDCLLVDEAHEFKNLPIATALSRVRGIPSTGNGSNKAFDMAMKVKLIQDRNNGRGAVFATGTPIANSIAELWVMSKYLVPEKLKAQGLDHFDNWVRQYGDLQMTNEVTATGRVKPIERFSKFINVPELSQAFRSYADVKRQSDLNLKLPKAHRIAVTCTESDQQKRNTEILQFRADNIDPRHLEIDNMPKICTDAKKNLLDARLLTPTAEDNPDGKINQCVDKVFQEWQGSHEHRGSQMIFCDLSTPKPERTAPEDNAAEQADGVEGAEPGALPDPAEDMRKWAAGLSGAKREFASAVTEWFAGGQNGPCPSAPSGLSASDAQGILDSAEDRWSGEDAATQALTGTLYADIRDKLIAKGIPREQIAFIHDAKTEAQKEELASAVRAGSVRVLLSSTAKGGTGLNVQERMVALHHLDCPWRPADLEQREGRIIRQGNIFADPNVGGGEARIYNYLGVSADGKSPTMDAFLWQKIQSKQQAIDQMMKGDSSLRTIEDVGEDEMTAAQYKAITSGNPLLQEQIKLEQDHRQLAMARAAHLDATAEASARMGSLPRRIEQGHDYLKRLDKVIAHKNAAAPPEGHKATAQIGDTRYETEGEAGDAIQAISLTKPIGWTGSEDIGRYHGFTIRLVGKGREMKPFALELEADRPLGESGETPVVIPVDMGDTGAGIFARIRNAVKDLDKYRDQHAKLVAQDEKNLEDLKGLAAEWPHEEKYQKVVKRLGEINAELAGQANKNAAPAAAKPLTKGDALRYVADHGKQLIVFVEMPEGYVDGELSEGAVLSALAKGMSFYGGKWYGESGGGASLPRASILPAGFGSGVSGLGQWAKGAGVRLRSSSSVAGSGEGMGAGASVHHLSAASGEAAAQSLRGHLRRNGFKVSGTSVGMGAGMYNGSALTRHTVTATSRTGEQHTFHIETRPWAHGASPMGTGPAPSPKPVPAAPVPKAPRTLGQAPRRSGARTLGRVLGRAMAKLGTAKVNIGGNGQFSTHADLRSAAPRMKNVAAGNGSGGGGGTTAGLMHTIAGSHGLTHVTSLPGDGSEAQRHYYTHRNPQERLLRLRSSLGATHDVSMVQQRRVSVHDPVAGHEVQRNEYRFTATPKGGGLAHTFHVIRSF